MTQEPDDLSHLIVEMATKRFTVRTLLPEDVGHQYLSWFSDPVVRSSITYQPGPAAIDDLRSFVEDHLSRTDSLLLGVFNHSERHVANIKYEPIDLQSRSVVLGVLIGDPNARGIGLFSEVFGVSSRLLAVRFGIECVRLGVSSDNSSAIRAYEKAGFSVASLEDENDRHVRMECLIGHESLGM